MHGLECHQRKGQLHLFWSAALFDGHQNDGHLHLDKTKYVCVHYVMFTQGNEPPISTQFSFLIFMIEIAHNHNHQESSSRSLNRHHHDYLSILFLLDHVVQRLLCWRRWVFPTERTIFVDIFHIIIFSYSYHWISSHLTRLLRFLTMFT